MRTYALEPQTRRGETSGLVDVHSSVSEEDGVEKSITPERRRAGGVNEKTPGGLCNFSNTSFCHAILLRGVREGVSVVNTMGGEIGREMVIEEFTAAIGMEAANGTTEVGARLLGPGDDKGRCFGLRAKEGDRGVS
ncbi:hypothetical protein CLOP_g22847 [Closterium sp. NIES-67]|nr:hypothetical protein CLOP_g22847 [Closterium sp. NIES-67]